jgi:hypothetical protein
MSDRYSVVQDINGYRVIFAEQGVCGPYDRPQHGSVESAEKWAEFILACHEAGMRLQMPAQK